MREHSTYEKRGVPGRVCLKSPERSSIVPPNRIVHSSQIIILHCFNTVVIHVCFFLYYTLCLGYFEYSSIKASFSKIRNVLPVPPDSSTKISTFSCQNRQHNAALNDSLFISQQLDIACSNRCHFYIVLQITIYCSAHRIKCFSIWRAHIEMTSFYVRHGGPFTLRIS